MCVCERERGAVVGTCTSRVSVTRILRLALTRRERERILVRISKKAVDSGLLYLTYELARAEGVRGAGGGPGAGDDQRAATRLRCAIEAAY